jgi:hypothetical protein
MMSVLPKVPAETLIAFPVDHSGSRGAFFSGTGTGTGQDPGKGTTTEEGQVFVFCSRCRVWLFLFFLLLPAMPALVLFLVDEVTLRLLAD